MSEYEEPKCPDCGKPADIPGEGLWCPVCEDYEGNCLEGHCMGCGHDL